MPGVSTSRMLARNLLGLGFDDLPPAAVDKAKTCIVDCLASVVGGATMPVSVAAVAMAEHAGSGGEATIWSSRVRAGVGDAAFANTTLAHSLLLEDTHILTQSHPGSVVIPTALTLGEALHASGRELIAAVVAGYEVMTRLGRAMITTEFNRRGFRPSGVLGPFASCLVACRLLNLDEDQACRALGIAGNCAAGVMEFAYAGTRDFPLHNAFAARNGITAAQLAQQGASGPEEIIEGPAGVGNAFAGTRCGFEGVRHLDKGALGILEVYSKAFPACGFVQTTPQAAMRIRTELGLGPDQIEEVVVGTFTTSATWPGTDYCGPFDTHTQAQMSHQFMLAAAMLDGCVTPATLENRKDPRYADLASRIRVAIDPECDRNYPPKQSTRLTIRTRDGGVYAIYEDDLEHPAKAAVIDRFSSIAAEVLAPEAPARLIAFVEQLEALPDVAVVPPLLARR